MNACDLTCEALALDLVAMTERAIEAESRLTITSEMLSVSLAQQYDQGEELRRLRASHYLLLDRVREQRSNSEARTPTHPPDRATWQDGGKSVPAEIVL